MDRLPSRPGDGSESEEKQRQERTGGGNVVASLTVPLMKAECEAGIVSYALVVHIHILSSLTLLGDGRCSELG